jgi:hypothetical protein
MDPNLDGSLPQTFMAVPNLKDLFGSKAEIVTDVLAVTEPISEQNPAIVIPFNSLASSGLNQVSSLTKAEKILLAIMVIATAWYRADSTEDPIAEASAVRESSQTRRGGRFLGYAYEFTFFRPQPAEPVVDPDLIDVLP